MSAEFIGQICKKPIGIEKDKNLVNAITKIIENKISRLYVFDSEKPVGIVSEKDILSFLYYGKKRSKSQVPVHEIMNKIFFCDDKMSLNKAAQFMVEKSCSSIAVGSENNFQGLVTKTDLTQYFSEHKKGLFKVQDHMSIHYFSVLTKDALFDVIKTMLGFGISRMIIVNEDKVPVGIVSTGDIFRAFLSFDKGDTSNKSLSEKLDEEIWSRNAAVGSLSAEKVMHQGIIKIGFDSDLADACKLMLDEDINAVGVANENQEMVGVLGKRDILLALRQEII